MQTIVKEIGYKSRSDRIKITPIPDIHFGASSCDEKAFRRVRDKILSEDHHYTIALGDYCEFINRNDRRRFKQSQLAKWLQGPIDDLAGAQVDYAVEQLKPLAEAGRIIGLGQGNHDDDILRHSERDVYRNIVEKLKDASPNPEDKLGLGYQGMIHLTMFRKRHPRATSGSVKTDIWKFVIYMHHGYGGGRLPGGHALSLGRVFTTYDCDLAIMGHRHVLQDVSLSALTVNSAGTIMERQRVAAFCSGFKKAFATETNGEACNAQYEEKAGYPPGPRGTYTFTLNPQDRTIKVEKTLYSGWQ